MLTGSVGGVSPGTVLTAPAFVNLAQFDNASLRGLLAWLEVVSPVSWSHHRTTLVLAGLCLVSSRSAGANRLWVAVVFALMFLPLQVVGHRVWPAADLVTDNLVVLLALLVACVLPFRTAAVESERVKSGDSATRRTSSQGAALARRG